MQRRGLWRKYREQVATCKKKRKNSWKDGCQGCCTHGVTAEITWPRPGRQHSAMREGGAHRSRKGCHCPQWCVPRWLSQALVDCLTPTPCGHAWFKAVGQKKKIKQGKKCDSVCVWGGLLGRTKGLVYEKNMRKWVLSGTRMCTYK